MTLAIDRNDPAITAHAELYRREMAAKRLQTLLGLGVFIACIVLAGCGGSGSNDDAEAGAEHLRVLLAAQPATLDPMESVEDQMDELDLEERESAIESGELDPGA